ncbi:sugar ABC transporter substrate-binding protein, partial [Microtetraspora sp. AC03309]|nr:sugar ABC transporter substrate-binding protein [Microtetraspora sp. AC03309]
IPEGGQLFQPLLEGYQALLSGTKPEEMLTQVDEKYHGIMKDWS